MRRVAIRCLDVSSKLHSDASSSISSYSRRVWARDSGPAERDGCCVWMATDGCFTQVDDCCHPPMTTGLLAVWLLGKYSHYTNPHCLTALTRGNWRFFSSGQSQERADRHKSATNLFHPVAASCSELPKPGCRQFHPVVSVDLR